MVAMDTNAKSDYLGSNQLCHELAQWHGACPTTQCVSTSSSIKWRIITRLIRGLNIPSTQTLAACYQELRNRKDSDREGNLEM